MKRNYPLVLALVCLLTFPVVAGAMSAGGDNFIVAKVDGTPITRQDFVQRAAQVYGPLLFNDLIRFKIAEARARELGATVTDDDLEQEVERIKASFKDHPLGPGAAFKSMLENQGLDREGFRKRFRLELLVGRIIGAEDTSRGGGNVDINAWFATALEDADIVPLDLETGKAGSVNGLPITLQDVQDASLVLLRVPQRIEVLQQIVVEMLVEKKLAALDFTLEEADMDQYVAGLKASYEGAKTDDAPSFEEWIARTGKSVIEYRATAAWRSEATVRKLLLHETSEQAWREHFKENYDLYGGKRVRASHIFVSAVNQSTGALKSPNAAEEAMQRIKDLRALLEGGEKFARLATRYSDDISASAGGDLGFFDRRGRGLTSGVFAVKVGVDPRVRQILVETFVRTAFTLSPGKTSEPVTTPVGACLIKVTDVALGKEVTYEDVAPLVRSDFFAASLPAYQHRLIREAKVEIVYEDLVR